MQTMVLNDVALTAGLIKKVLAAACVGAGFIVILEPTHTQSMPLLAAFSLWFTHLLFVAGLFCGGVLLLQKAKYSDPIPAIVTTLLLPAPFALASLGLDYGFGNDGDTPAQSLSFFAIFVDETLAVAPLSFAIALVMVFMLRQRPSKMPLVEDQPASSSLPLRQLISSIPRSLGDDIIRLHAQDHYVEIVTTKGTALLTEQFGDCLERLSVLNGFQCHRSHWISLAHVERIARSGSAYTCEMRNGDHVPVSRRRYSELREKLGFGASSKQ